MAEKTTIARPYAEAVFKLAQQQGQLKEWSERLQLCAAIASNPEMAALIGNPKIGNRQLTGLFGELCGDRLDEHGKNFIATLVENDRLGLLPEIAELYEQARAEAEGVISAEVVSAMPLGDAERQKIAESLKKRLGRDVELECSVDEGLLGGAVIRAGDLVIDGSARGQVERLSNALLR
ncbi:MAG TPA: F0F1 ATP synthase subunit delta [Candidatus Tenderia sp.]|nr:F0F1 ATP synthase subunit delta [Candidatus Tenderia sp.]